MPTTNSILRYPGGKTAYASLLKEVIHLNGLKGTPWQNVLLEVPEHL